ncbi:MAG: hypothetical protein K6E87_01525 [bacterium]|nr:hypothetical protein [bacterium]
MYNINDNASICVLNYFHDFGYSGSINDLGKISTFENCESPLYFIKKLEELKLEASLVTMRIEDVLHIKKEEFPVFAICELDNRKTFYLPVYKIEGEYVTIKDSNCFNRRVKIDDFNKYYDGKVIKITNNKEFLKEYFIKKDLKMKLFFEISFIASSIIEITFLSLFVIFFSIKKGMNFQVGLFLGLALLFIIITLFFGYKFYLARKTLRRKSSIKDPNKSYYKKHYDMPKDGTKVKGDSNLLYGLEMAADILEVICDIASIFK